MNQKLREKLRIKEENSKEKGFRIGVFRIFVHICIKTAAARVIEAARLEALSVSDAATQFEIDQVAPMSSS